MNANEIQRPLVLKDGEFIDLAKHKELYIEEMLLQDKYFFDGEKSKILQININEIEKTLLLKDGNLLI